MTGDEKVAEVKRILDDPGRSDVQKLDAIRAVLYPPPAPEPQWRSGHRAGWNPEDDPDYRGRAWRPPHTF